MGKMTGGELLVKTLRDLGARHVFSIIGGQMCSIYDAISHEPDMNLTTLRNEAAAPMMAAGCAAVTGSPSVSMATVGAGVVYEVAGLMAAWYNYLPVVSISPQVQSWKMKPHQENLQGLNQDGVFEPITKWNAIVYHWDRIPSLTHRAIREALANAPGPTHLDFPVDVLFQTKNIDDDKLAKLLPRAETTRFVGALPGSPKIVEKAWEALAKSERPVVIVGQGFGRQGRQPDVVDKLNALGAPTLTSECSSGIMDGRDEAYAGALSLYSAKDVADADLLLIIGIDDQVAEFLRGVDKSNKTIVQIEIDPSALLVGENNFVGVNADPLSFLDAKESSKSKWKDWSSKFRKIGDDIVEAFMSKSPRDSRIFSGIAEALDENDVVVVDGAATVAAANAFLRSARYRDLFVMNTRDMAGVGLPFAIGAKIGSPENRVALISDRDSLMRHVQELSTAVATGVSITIICVDPGEGAAATRAEAIFDGLGCDVARLKAGDKPARPASKKPLAILCD